MIGGLWYPHVFACIADIDKSWKVKGGKKSQVLLKRQKIENCWYLIAKIKDIYFYDESCEYTSYTYMGSQLSEVMYG